MMTRCRTLLQPLGAVLMLAWVGTASAQEGPTLDRLWTRPINGVTDMKVTGMARAGSDGFVIAGEFSDTIEFGPTPGSMSLRASGARDVFIARHDKAGRYLWAKRLGGNGGTFIATYGGIVPGDNGSVYVAGSFVGTTDFDPGPGAYPETAQGALDAFIVKLDGDGQLIWAQRYGSPGGTLTVNAVAANAGSVALVGTCGGGVVLFGATYCGTPGVNGFLLRVDAGAGSAGWARTVCSYTCTARTVAVQDDGYVLVNADGLRKYDPFGAPNGSSYLGAGANLALTIDSQGAIFAAGGSNSQATVVKITQAPHPFYGTVFTQVWDWTLPGPGESLAFSLRLDGSAIDVAGRFSGTAALEPLSLVSKGLTDAFVVRIDPLGAPLLAESFGGGDADEADAIDFDASGNLYAAGVFKATADFDPGPAVYNLTSSGGSDGFIWKLGLVGLDVEGTDPSLLRFTPDDPGLSFDVVKGLVSELQAGGSYAQAACLGTFTGNPAADASTPPPGDAFYYLARGRSCCTSQGYGDSTLVPDPRDALDIASPCP